MLGGLATALLTSAARQAGNGELARIGALLSLAFVALITIFVVPPLLRAARWEVARIDLPLQLTLGGALFLGIFLVVAFAAYNTGNNLLFLIFAVLLATGFVAWSAGRAALRDLIVSARFPDHIFAGETAPVIVRLHNTKRVLPSFSILVEARERLPAAVAAASGSKRKLRRLPRARSVNRTLAYFVYVPHRAWAQLRVEQIFPRRGRVLVTGFELSTRFPFGFFRLRRRLRARDVDLIVYPQLVPASDDLHLLPMRAGQMLSARRGAGHDLHSLRDYQPRDDVRHIDWKATARASRLVVREFAAEDEWRVHVVFDTRSVTGGKKEAATPAEEGVRAVERFERGVTLAASLIAHLLEERAEVRLTLGRETGGAYGAESQHLYECLRRLALVEPEAAAVEDANGDDYWERVFESSVADDNYVILLTAATPGSLPAHVWRQSHVIYI